jgi:flagella basal body P-ring formation protein FlgA
VPGGLCRQRFFWRTAVSILARTNYHAIALLSGFAVCCSVGAAELDSPWHPIDDIAATAEQFVLDQFSNTDARMTPKAGHLDARLRLKKCSEPLESFAESSAVRVGRTVVGVRCNDAGGWKLYVPVNVTMTDTVVIARRSLPSGHTLTMADLAVEEREVSRLSRGYLARPEEVLGKHLKQQLLPGRVIAPAMLLEATMIERGQSVTIVARGGGLNIEMRGTALSDGTVNERIKVENAASKRIIEAIVRSPEIVEVLVY